MARKGGLKSPSGMERNEEGQNRNYERREGNASCGKRKKTKKDVIVRFRALVLNRRSAKL